MSNILSLEEHNALYKQMHQEPIFKGYSLRKFIPHISSLVVNSNITSVLDFGCGKAECWIKYNLKDQLGISKLGLYDPGVDKFSILPNIKYDLVVCIDVLEHVPENLLDTVFDQIFSVTGKVFFCNISTRLAGKTLPNGDNAHATVKPKEWWLEKMKKYNKLIISHFD